MTAKQKASKNRIREIKKQIEFNRHQLLQYEKMVNENIRLLGIQLIDEEDKCEHFMENGMFCSICKICGYNDY